MAVPAAAVILLCLRCLAVAMLVLAFCRPVWLDARTKSSAAGKGAAVVLLIDTSASTAQRAEEVSVIGELRAAGIRTLDSLRVGTDVANVVLASARPHAVFPNLSANVPGLREELSRLEATFDRGDLLQGLTLAGQLLAAHDGQRRLVILSDLQRTNWQEVAQGRPGGHAVAIRHPGHGDRRPHARPRQCRPFVAAAFSRAAARRSADSARGSSRQLLASRERGPTRREHWTASRCQAKR